MHPIVPGGTGSRGTRRSRSTGAQHRCAVDVRPSLAADRHAANVLLVAVSGPPPTRSKDHWTVVSRARRRRGPAPDRREVDWASSRPVSFCRLPRRWDPIGSQDGVRLMFENSTVCLIVDELVCMALSTAFLDCSFFGWFGFVVWVLIDDSGFFASVVCQFWIFHVFDGEFDPGSGRTLAACLTHASRAERLLWGYSSGERVSNT